MFVALLDTSLQSFWDKTNTNFRGVFRTQSNIIFEKKSSILDVCLGSKYASTFTLVISGILAVWWNKQRLTSTKLNSRKTVLSWIREKLRCIKFEYIYVKFLAVKLGF